MRRAVPPSTLAWVAFAVMGLVIAVGVSYAASQLSKPKVGLTSEPVSGVAELAPKSASSKRTRQPSRRDRAPERPAPTTTSSTPTTTTTTPVPTPQAGDDDGDNDD